jgi:diguanylate cyclase (GGDEF)-like protein
MAMTNTALIDTAGMTSKAGAASALEERRLAELDSYDILDTPNEESFDRITRLAKNIFGVSIATISFIDGHRQWFKSQQGLSDCQTSRDASLCQFTVQEIDPLVISDTLADDRYRQNACVVGEPHVRFYAGVQLRAPKGQAIGTLCIADSSPRSFDARQLAMLTDLGAIAMNELDLRRVANIDTLTRALSRRAFRDDASREIALAMRHGHQLSCVIFDLDHFKTINDSFGHGVGDTVLVECLDACRAQLRQSDIVGRIGGEEFAILLPHTTRADAMGVADKIRSAIATRSISPPTLAPLVQPVRVTASFGVASLSKSVTDIDSMLKCADAALYEAKAEGRNRCKEWLPADSALTAPATPDVPATASVIRRVLKSGQITFNAGRSTIDCTVRALSDVGASIDVISSAGIPDSFKLQIESDGFSRGCRIISKRDRRIDVQFV